MNKRLKEIHEMNARWEKESPYNFCDRWCERCVHEKQIRCALYKDELERKITCIAHGRDEDDSEITEAIMEEQYKEVDEKLSECRDKFGINPDVGALDDEDTVDFESLPQDVQKHLRFVQNNPLELAAKSYCHKARAFLQNTFYDNDKVDPILKYDFEVVSWYHTLLQVKLHRALCGFHEPACEGELALYDAVAQFQVCKKVITLSIDALRKISPAYPAFSVQIKEMLALSHNIHSRIVAMEESIT